MPGGDLIYERSFPAQSEIKKEVLDALILLLQERCGIKTESDEMKMRLCLDEALVNAVMHGSKFDATLTIRVRIFLEAAKWSVLVEDEGKGFLEEDLPDPDAPENLFEESGRGVILMRSWMDEVSYWNNGAALLMSRKL